MEQKRRNGVAHRPGGVFPLLALILAVVTLVGLFSHFSPAAALGRAWKKTGKALGEKEAGILFFADCLKEGAWEIESGEKAISYQASLPKKASLSWKDGDVDLTLAAEKDTVSVQSEALLSEAISGERNGAAARWEESPLDALDGEAQLLSRLFLAFSDPALYEDKEMSSLFAAMAKKAKIGLKKESGTLAEAMDAKATVYRILIPSQGLVGALEEMVKQCQKESIREALFVRLDAAAALAGKTLSEEERDAVEKFLSGEGLLYELFLGLCEDEGAFEIVSYVCHGAVSAVELKGAFGDFEAACRVFFGEKITDSKAATLTLSLSMNGEEVWNLRLEDTIADDSKDAYIRTLRYESTGFAAMGGEIRFSWGKKRGDLGLRWITPEGEWNLRGTMDEQKKGKIVSFHVSSIEYNKEERLPDGGISVTIRSKGKPLAPEKGEAALFGEESEISEIRDEITEKRQALLTEDADGENVA